MRAVSRAECRAEYEALLRRIDFTALLAKRRANVARLRERLAALDGTRLRFLSGHPEESTLYFPVYLENRSDIQRAMAQHGVYCPVIWPEPGDSARSVRGEPVCDGAYARPPLRPALHTGRYGLYCRHAH